MQVAQVVIGAVAELKQPLLEIRWGHLVVQVQHLGGGVDAPAQHRATGGDGGGDRQGDRGLACLGRRIEGYGSACGNHWVGKPFLIGVVVIPEPSPIN